MCIHITQPKNSKLKRMSGKTLPNSYIVVLNPQASDQEVAEHMEASADMFAVLNDNEPLSSNDNKRCTQGSLRSSLKRIGNFKSYTVNCMDESDLDDLLGDESVAYIEENSQVSIDNPKRSNNGKIKTHSGPKVANSYIVTMKPGTTKNAINKHMSNTRKMFNNVNSDVQGLDRDASQSNCKTTGKGRGKLMVIGSYIAYTVTCLDEVDVNGLADDITVEMVEENVILSIDGNGRNAKPVCRRGQCSTTEAPSTTNPTNPTTPTTTTNGPTNPTTTTNGPTTPTTQAPATTTSGSGPACDGVSDCATRSMSSDLWGLDRIDETLRSLDGSFTGQGIGTGVDAYIIDTGIRYSHTEFCGRVEPGMSFVGTSTANDDQGHGTHVAGTVGGKSVGVAQDVTLIPVKVLSSSGSGTLSGVIEGIQWAVNNMKSRNRKSVGNMSLGGGSSSSLNDAADAAVDEGMVMVVSAGNSNSDACSASPAGAPKCLTVGSTTSSDSKSSFSSWGTCVDVFAPGSSIYSSTYNGDSSYGFKSGTSMSAPHVAGVVAAYLSSLPETGIINAFQVNDWVVNQAVNDQLSGLGTGSPNKMLRTLLCGQTPTLPPTTTAAPTSAPTTPQQGACGIVNCETKSVTPWGIDRIDQTSGTSNTFKVDGTGFGVNAYVIDTGILYDHVEFCGRVAQGYNFVAGNTNANDDNNHGTHCAGTVGGTNVGVARDVTLVPVKVLSASGSGYTSDVIAGINWAYADTQQSGRKGVINLSLGSQGINQASIDAVNNAVAGGMIVAVAAGNSNDEACNYTPAAAQSAVTVGATTSSDARSSFSNWGSCLDVFAPGSSIYSSVSTGTSSYASFSGTSMAAPHVAGVAAAFFSSGLGTTPAQFDAWLTSTGVNNIITDPQGSRNLFLQSPRCA